MKRQANLFPQSFRELTQRIFVRFPRKLEFRNSIIDGVTTLASTRFVVFLQDLVDRGSVESAVVVQIVERSIDFLQTEFQLTELR